MSLARVALVCSMGLVLGACDCAGSASPPPSVAAPPSSVAPPPTSAAATTTAPDAGPRVLDPATRAHLRELLRTGRAAVRTEDYDAALTAFEEIVTLDPQNRRLRCEAGYVAYRGGHTDRARTLIEAALAGMPDTSHVPQPLRIPTAQCLYNAGLVRESAGDLAGARAAWIDSLALRANATVQTHLDALPAAVTEPHVVGLGLPRSASDDDIDAALVRQLAAEAHAEAWGGADPDSDDFAGAPVVRVAIGADPGVTVPPGVAVVQLLQASQQLGAVVVRARDAVTALVVFEVDVGGIGGVLADAHITSARASEVIGGGVPELLIEIEESDEDQDMAGCVQYAMHTTRRVVCTLGTSPGCAAFDVAGDDTESCDDACMADPGGEDEEEEGAESSAFRCGVGGYPAAGVSASDPISATLTFHEESVVYAGELAGARAGTYELAGLLASFGVPAITVHPFE